MLTNNKNTENIPEISIKRTDLITFLRPGDKKSGVFLRPDGQLELVDYTPDEAATLIFEHIEAKIPKSGKIAQEYEKKIAQLNGIIKMQEEKEAELLQQLVEKEEKINELAGTNHDMHEKMVELHEKYNKLAQTLSSIRNIAAD